ncbi:MAG: YczE/YyaS/YitT family protein [Actinomycetota bacterium]
MFIPVRGKNLQRRFIQLLIGLVLFGVGIAMMLQSRLGLPPWDVLHQGLTEEFGITVGIWSIIISVGILVLWLPLREKYGVGTVLNAIIIGVVIDIGALVIPQPESVWWNIVLMLGGIVLIGLASGMYIGANLGPGPRDGLMTAIARRGPSIRLTRWGLEVVVLITGILLGGTFGVGTIAFAVFIGPIVQFFLPRWSIDTGRAEDAWDHPAR